MAKASRYGSAYNPDASKVQVGLALDASVFKNFMQAMESFQASGGTYAYPSILNADQYPTGTIPTTLFGTCNFPSNVNSGTTLVFAWTGTATNSGAAALQISAGSPGFTVTAGSGFVIGGTSFNIGVAGTNGYIEFNTNSNITGVTFDFLSGSTFTGLSNIILCQKSDYASIIAATNASQLIAGTFISKLQALKPPTIRMLGLNDVNDNNCFTQHRYRLNWQTALSFANGGSWIPTCWAGTSSGTNAYTIGAATDTPAAYTLGEVLQLQFINASTSTPLTINVNARGVVPLYNMTGTALANVAANALATLIYDDLLGGYLVNFGPYGGIFCVPVETQVGICNAVGANLWYNFPPHITHKTSVLEPTSSSTSQIAALISSTLNHGCFFEYANEVWNFAAGFPQTIWAMKSGAALGFPSDNNRQYHGYYGYRLAVMWPLVKAAWGSKAGLRCVNAFQAFGVTGLSGSTNLYRLQGVDLASVANGGQGNATWISYTGNANFTASPNRPVDVSDALSYATYYSGAQCANFDANYSNAGGTGLTTGHPSSGLGSTLNGLLGAADAFASGDTLNAIGWLDWDIRQGTNNGTAGGETLNALLSIYSAWETVAASYDGARPAGKANLIVACYEGAMECAPPSTSECTTLGISTSYGGASGKIGNLLTGYKNSVTFNTTVQQQYTSFFAQTHSTYGSWFVVNGNSQWSMSLVDMDSPFWQSYNATAMFN